MLRYVYSWRRLSIFSFYWRLYFQKLLLIATIYSTTYKFISIKFGSNLYNTFLRRLVLLFQKICILRNSIGIETFNSSSFLLSSFRSITSLIQRCYWPFSPLSRVPFPQSYSHLFPILYSLCSTPFIHFIQLQVFFLHIPLYRLFLSLTAFTIAIPTFAHDTTIYIFLLNKDMVMTT